MRKMKIEAKYFVELKPDPVVFITERFELFCYNLK